MLDFREKYIKLIALRKGKIHSKVKEALIKLLYENNVDKVYLVGSYANGDYIDEQTPEWVKEYRRSFGKRDTLSDVDFYTIPKIKPTEDYDIVPEYRNSAILVYDNGKLLI